MSTIDNLKKEAKHWLKEVRRDNPGPRKRLRLAYPNAPDRPGLRDIQHALAREHGHESWKALLDAVALRQTRGTPEADQVRTFLEYACWDHHTRGPAADARNQRNAARILEHHPEIARDNLYTAMVCGDRAEIERLLDAAPELANAKGGPRHWEPILYLCYARLPIPAVRENAAAITRLLLDRGANPNAYYMAGDALYSTLVGVGGEGEQDVQPHPERETLYQLLLERGAEPFDIQVLYNTHFHGDVLWWLELTYAHTVKTGRTSDWANPDWPMLDMGGYGSGARFLLWIALQKNDLRLAEWLLSHGANPNAAPPASARLPQGTVHEEARRLGFDAMADLLVRHGARPSAFTPSDEDAFGLACFHLDHTAVNTLLAAHPEYLRATNVIFAAARRDRADVVALLLDRGVPVDIEDGQKQRPLHVAASHNAVAVLQMLIERGAEIDPRETNWGNTPLMSAVYHQHQEAIRILSRVSRDVWNLTMTGNLGRLREVIEERPELARASDPKDLTPLFWLPDAEDRALEAVELLIAHGADPSVTTNDGWTAARYARKRGLDAAAALLETGAPRPAAVPGLDRFDALAADIVTAFDTGDAGALNRLGDHYQRAITADDLREGIWHRVRTVREGKGKPGSLPIADARALVAREAGFGNWDAFARALGTGVPASRAYKIDATRNTISPRRLVSEAEWDQIIGVIQERGITGLDANGQMTDAALDRVSHLGDVTRLNLGDSQWLTDAGLQHLARMPQLEELELSEYPGGRLTDRGLEVLRHLPSLRTFHMCWQRGITDAGAANLTFCDRLESVDLLGTHTGDGAINALRGKRSLRRFKTGRQVTNAGLALLRDFPALTSWPGGESHYSLMSVEGGPTHLLIDGSFTDAGLADLAALEGLFGLSFFWHTSAITAGGLRALAGLPNLEFLGCGGALCDDTAMGHIAALPRLRMLMAQGTVATDEGFASLGRSRTIERIWGRECPNLTGPGFRALSRMPSLRGLAVSCKRVDDASLSTLPHFPALRELLPMDVGDEGFRHVGACVELEALTCMYCRETTDRATEHLANLSKLKTYYAGATQITDRSLEMLGRLAALERIELYECKGVSDAGLGSLAHLPRLKEIALHGLPHVTLDGAAVFPAHVHVDYSV